MQLLSEPDLDVVLRAVNRPVCIANRMSLLAYEVDPML